MTDELDQVAIGVDFRSAKVEETDTVIEYGTVLRIVEIDGGPK